MTRGLVALLLLGSAPALFAQSVVVHPLDIPLQEARSPQAYARARALPLPRVEAPADLLARPSIRAGNDDGDSLVEAQPPTLAGAERRRFATVLFDMGPQQLQTLRGLDRPGVLEKAWGTGGLDFTSSRLIPRSAVEIYPYSAVGKLFFSAGDDDYVCSAAVIARRLVLTAGHCVHDGPDAGFFDGFEFVPAYRNGLAPYGSWTASAAFVSQDWADSGEVPHPQDWAVLEIADRDGVAIGDVVGWLGYRLYRLADNHLHLLGYPGDLDQGEQMHQVTSGDWYDPEDGTVIYGSDMGGGSSGGPWVQNFSRRGRWTTTAVRGKWMAIVGVTSYGFLDGDILAQGASVLSQDFEALLAEACANQAGNC